MTKSETKRFLNKGSFLTTGQFDVPHQGFSGGSETSRTYLWTFTPLFDFVGLQMAFPNWSIGNGGSPAEVTGQNDITIKVGASNGTQVRQLTFNGAGTATIAPSGNVVNDPLQLQFYAGVPATIRVCVSVGTMGQKWPLAAACTNSKTGDLTLSGTIDDAASTAYSPLWAIGKPTSFRTKMDVVVFGDSLMVGGGETPYMGYAVRGLNAAGVAWHRVAMASNRISYMNTATNAYALTQVLNSPAEIVFCALGSNDALPAILANTITNLSQLLAIYTPMWNKIAASGRKIWVPTFTPYTGTPAFNTAQMQLRSDLNNQLRAGIAPIDRVIDVGLAAETSMNSNVWKTGYAASDGIHLTTTGSTAVGAALFKASDFLL